MASVNIRKRGKVYQYQFEAASVDGKRKQITKSGFKTKAEAQEEGTKAYNDYLNTGIIFNESKMSYSDYLDYWMENYCKVNLKYNTIQAYKTIIKKYLKPNLGKYRLASFTSVKLNTFIVELCQKHSFSKAYFRNILKVLKGTFREACDKYGLIRYNPTLTLKLPKIEETDDKKTIKHIYNQKEIDAILQRFKDNDSFTCAFLTSCFTRNENRRGLRIDLEGY
ncbi:MAG: Arm DNA-binding domain-containing protein [Clostridia bacterium]|nr:Arm DNA-binding domain-containing protein [Clostridia bacterium]